MYLFVHISHDAEKNATVCSAEVVFVDQFTQERITLYNSEVDPLGASIMFTLSSERLMLNRIYDVMVTASNIKGSATSNTEISKKLKVT